MATLLLDALRPLLPGAFDRIVVPPAIRLLLDHLSPNEPFPAALPAGPIVGTVQSAANDTLGGVANLDIAPLGPAVPFTLTIQGPAAAPTGFRFDLRPADGLLKLPAACKPATVQTVPAPPGGAAKKRLVPAAGDRVTVNGLVAIRVEGSVSAAASLRFVAPGGEDAVIALTLNPPAFTIGGQGFGFHLPGGFVLDSSGTEAPPPVVNPSPAALPSATPAWQGIAVRGAELFLPESTPLFGGTPIPVDFELGSPAGLYGHTEAHIPAEGSRPAIDVTVTWNDPAATSFAAALPTTVALTTTWDLESAALPEDGGTVDLLGGDPLRVTGRFGRVPASGELSFGLTVEAAGDQGLLTVRGANTAGKVVVTASALATAFIADADPPGPQQPNYDGSGATLHALLVAAAGLSAFLADGSVTVHAVEIETGFAAAGTKLVLRVDYSVDVVVTPIDLGVLSIEMSERVPMRLRYRNVRLLVDFSQTDPLERFHLSFGEAEVGVEDPGGWRVKSPGSVKDLFDVLGSRSGHGSQWFEVDLRFALDLGPVKVSGATVRATLGAGGLGAPEVRGLEASLNVPALLTGTGKAALGPGKLDLALAANIVPLNIGGFASLSYGPCDGVEKLVFAVGVDLPGPIPLANSGLGVYGLGGIFGQHAALPALPPGADPIAFQLGIDPFQAPLNPLDTSKYGCRRDGTVLGFGAVVGTAPDLGFTFSARAVVVVAVPDFALRASLDGAVLSPRVKMAPETFATSADPNGLSFLGLLAVTPSPDDDDRKDVTIALRARYRIPVLLDVDVPFGGFFPGKGNGWYVHLGADGVTPPGKPRRGPGPIQARILPDLLDIGAWAFFMVHGDGLERLGDDPAMTLSGFAIGFGAGFNARYGVAIIYIELSASLIVGLGTNPFLLVGKGHLSGALHLGPVSIGASAEVFAQIGPAASDSWAKFEVCGEVDLFFFSLKGCVTIKIGSESDEVPPPPEWPLRGVALADHLYTKLPNGDAKATATDPDLPVVWPDAIPILSFAFGPARNLAAGPFTAALNDNGNWNPVVVGDGKVGNERLSYAYSLTDLQLSAVDEAGNATPVAGPLDAAWQPPVAGGDHPGARELALLTWETHLWTRKLLDGAAGAPHDPIPAIADRCRPDRRPTPGWALGGLGFRAGPGDPWQLPTEPKLLGPFDSVFAVLVNAVLREIVLDEHTIALLDSPFPWRLSGPRALPASLPIEAAERDFGGAFLLPHLTGIPLDADPNFLALLGEGRVRATLTFSQPLSAPLLALLLPRWPEGAAFEQVSVALIHANGSIPFSPIAEEPGPDDAVVRVYADEGQDFLGVTIDYPPTLAVEILGLRAITASARQKADDANDADAQAAANADEKAEAGPLPTRSFLAADTLYKLDVSVQAVGTRENGASDTFDKSETFWFRTAKVADPPVDPESAYIQQVYPPSVLFKTDAFDPTYLQRYVASWMPADKTRFWFRTDPVGVQTLVNHIPELAALYDRDVKVRVRRTDPTEGSPDPFAYKPQEFPSLDQPVFRFGAGVSIALPAADLRLAALTEAAGEGCRYPRPGSTLGGRPVLAPLASYEVLLVFPPNGEEDGPAITGTLFSTSRYETPEHLLAAVGFGAGGVGLAGDIPVERVPGLAAGVVVGDGALEQALVRLGLGRWPLAAAPRASALWTREGDGWLLHGILLEAPEPLHRPDGLGIKDYKGRLLIDDLSAGGQPLGTLYRSAAGDRLLFLAGTPFIPAGPLALGVTTRAVPLEATTAPATMTLTCPIGAAPAFAEDLA